MTLHTRLLVFFSLLWFAFAEVNAGPYPKSSTSSSIAAGARAPRPGASQNALRRAYTLDADARRAVRSSGSTHAASAVEVRPVSVPEPTPRPTIVSVPDGAASTASRGARRVGGSGGGVPRGGAAASEWKIDRGSGMFASRRDGLPHGGGSVDFTKRSSPGEKLSLRATWDHGIINTGYPVEMWFRGNKNLRYHGYLTQDGGKLRPADGFGTLSFTGEQLDTGRSVTTRLHGRFRNGVPDGVFAGEGIASRRMLMSYDKHMVTSWRDGVLQLDDGMMFRDSPPAMYHAYEDLNLTRFFPSNYRSFSRDQFVIPDSDWSRIP